MALAALDFIDRHEVVHFIGQSGTGKSHLTSNDATLTAAIQDGMNGDDGTVLENANLVGGAVYFHCPPTCAVRHAVEIAVDRDHAIARDASLEPQHGLEHARCQRLERRALLGEMLGQPAWSWHGRAHWRPDRAIGGTAC